MLEALIAGEQDPAAIAELGTRRMRPKIPALTEALTGRFGDHHRFMTRLFLDRIDAHNAAIDFVLHIGSREQIHQANNSTPSSWMFGREAGG